MYSTHTILKLTLFAKVIGAGPLLSVDSADICLEPTFYTYIL